MQEPSYMGKNPPSINMVYDSIDPNNNSNMQRYSHLEILIKHHVFYRSYNLTIDM